MGGDVRNMLGPALDFHASTMGVRFSPRAGVIGGVIADLGPCGRRSGLSGEWRLVLILVSMARGFQAETGEEWEECEEWDRLPGAFREMLLDTGGSCLALTDVGVDGSAIIDVLLRLAFDVMVMRP